MYNNPQQGQAALTAPETEAAKVAGLRNLILDLLFASPVITAKEWATAVERTSNTESVATLLKWYQNTAAEIGRREAAATAAPEAAATKEQKQDIVRLLNHPAVSRPRKTKVLLNINRLTDAQAVAIIVTLRAETMPTRPAGARVVIDQRGQLALASLTRYANKACTAMGGISTTHPNAA